MITKLRIERFKSVLKLELDCARINLFIGLPNTGKSNLLEALGFLSWGCECERMRKSSRSFAGVALKDFVRMTEFSDLFYDGLTGEGSIRICAETPQRSFEVSAVSEQDHLNLYGSGADVIFAKLSPRKTTPSLWEPATYNPFAHPEMPPVRFYRFRDLAEFPDRDGSVLKPPFGENLFEVVRSSRERIEPMGELFQIGGLRLGLKMADRNFELRKEVGGVVYSYPYGVVSDTLRRIAFYTMAMASNQDAVLVFEEPEAHAFPFYTRSLGERIARDTSNQYFIATHNPYLLEAIVEKAPKEDVAVFATYFKDYQTQTRRLKKEELETLLDQDPFLALDELPKE